MHNEILHSSAKEGKASCVWWCTPVIPALGRLKQEDLLFKASLGYIARPCLKKKAEKVNINAELS
jgi:hypothetical protein